MQYQSSARAIRDIANVIGLVVPPAPVERDPGTWTERPTQTARHMSAAKILMQGRLNNIVVAAGRHDLKIRNHSELKRALARAMIGCGIDARLILARNGPVGGPGQAVEVGTTLQVYGCRLLHRIAGRNGSGARRGTEIIDE